MGCRQKPIEKLGWGFNTQGKNKMKIETSKDELLDLIPETEEEKMLLEILSKRDVRIASHGRNTSTGFTNLCLQFKERDAKSTQKENPANYCLSCNKYLGFKGFCSKDCHDQHYDNIDSTKNEVNICKECGYHANFHYDEFMKDDRCTKDECKCKMFSEDTKSQPKGCEKYIGHCEEEDYILCGRPFENGTIIYCKKCKEDRKNEMDFNIIETKDWWICGECNKRFKQEEEVFEHYKENHVVSQDKGVKDGN